MIIQQSQIAQFDSSCQSREVNLEAISPEELLGRKDPDTETCRDEIDEAESGVVIGDNVGLLVVWVLWGTVPESKGEMAFCGTKIELVEGVAAEVVAVGNLLAHWVLF